MENNKYSLFDIIGVRYQDILNIPELAIGEGVTTFFGPSGSGKTSILKLLNRLISPTSGQIFYKGTALEHTDPIDHRRKVVMLSQNPVMFKGSIKDNLNASFRFRNHLVPEDKTLSDVLENVGLDKDLGFLVDKLSGGEKQRLALARVILLKPEVYLLDEPSSALDDNSADVIIETLYQRVRSESKSMIMVTHSKSIAQKYSNNIINVAGGKIISRGFSDE